MYYTTAQMPHMYNHANESLYSNVRTWQSVDDPSTSAIQSDDQDSDDANLAAIRHGAPDGMATTHRTASGSC